MVAEEAFLAKRQICRATLAKQVGLRKRWALIGQCAFVKDERYIAGETLLAQGGCALEAGVPGPEDQDAVHDSRP